MLRTCLQASILLLLFTLFTGVLYPLSVTLLAQAAFPGRANGSLILRDGKILGSALIGQEFSAPGYFWGRPSGTTPAYNGGASSGSNYGIYNASLVQRIDRRAEELKKGSSSTATPIPVDLLTASGSGLDPHISPSAAEWQLERVAQARGIPQDTLRQLIAAHTEGRQFGILGEPRVNVLQLNLALDAGAARAQNAPHDR